MELRAYLNDHILILDGGMGSLLQQSGLGAGEAPEGWNLTHPDAITAVHRAYLEAGSRLLCTNTFGVNGLRYDENEIEALVGAGVACARRAIAESGVEDAWVALDIGPIGRLLAPFGDTDFEQAVDAFAATVRAGVRAGVDAVFIETMNDCYETKAALLCAKENSTLPVFVSNAYGRDGRLMTGGTPSGMVAMLEGMGADAVGVNCSFGPQELAGVVEEYLACASVPTICKPNAGIPKLLDGRTVYPLSPEDFARSVAELVKKGVRMVGGCCGTTPAHIAALAEAIRGIEPAPIGAGQGGVISSYARTVRFGSRPILIGERINPTGKKKLCAALRAGDIDYLLKEGQDQEALGADVLDVNVGLPDLDEEQTLSHVICELQAVSALPLQIDTASPAALAAALRRYNGKALINSVSGKEESMRAVFPLVKKYGGMVVALTLDEDGIPADVEGRLAIARRILARAEEWGIDRRDLIFDPLALTVSADQSAAAVTLETVRRIGSELGCLTSLGVSNVSFGLPARDRLNGAFLTMALQNGLSAAILNPRSEAMRTAYHSYLALSGQDERCERYIAYASALSEPSAASALPAKEQSDAGEEDSLRTAIVKGRASRAAALCAEALKAGEDGMALIRDQIVPALDEVGVGYESKRIYLPALLVSAEAAGAAFEQIKASMQSERGAGGCPFVLATVQGDIHDIGKNIVKLLLENYGFDVIDLGRDVPCEQVVEAVIASDAPLCGLSALMTTTLPAMERTVALLKEKAPRCRVVVGGAVLNRAFAERIGADCYAADAMETVRFAEAIRDSI